MNPPFFVRRIIPLYPKRESMNKMSKWLLGIWMILAVLSFVVSFWAPLFIKVVGIVFGSLNLMIIGSLVITYFQGLAQGRKLKELEEKEGA